MCARRIWRNHITARANTVRPYSLYTLMFWPRRGQCGKRKKSVKKNAALLHFLGFFSLTLLFGVPRGACPPWAGFAASQQRDFFASFLVTKRKAQRPEAVKKGRHRKVVSPASRKRSLIQFKVPRQQQRQIRVSVSNKPFCLVQNGLFQNIPGHTSVAVGRRIRRLLLIIPFNQHIPAAFV